MLINAKTKVCAVIGNPIEHSLSPAMHNAGYEKLGLNFIYVAFRVEQVHEAIAGIKGLNIKGISVTVPHKVSVIPLLNNIENTAKEIGAINTIVNTNGDLTGYNTDWEGAMRALKEKTNIANKKVVLVGAGGAARAIAFGLNKQKANITIINRDLSTAEALAKEINASCGNLSKLPIISDSDILIHATPVGMSPQADNSLISRQYLHKNLIVFDIVYNPKKTKLIQDAKKNGCYTIYGYKMLLYQAVKQFELFTEREAPIETMEQALLKQLERKN